MSEPSVEALLEGSVIAEAVGRLSNQVVGPVGRTPYRVG